MQYDALLLDNDGVILERRADDRRHFGAAVRAAFRDHDVAAPDDADVRDLVYGVTVARLDSICEAYGLDPDAFWRSRDEHCSRVQREAIADGLKGAYPDVSVLHDLPGPMGVVSSNQQRTLEFAYDRLDVPAFDVVCGRPPTVESIRRKKPDPHYLDRTLDALDAGTALYVGDSPHDVVAAHEAGLDAAFVRREHNRDTVLAETPEYTLDGLTDLPATLAPSP